MAPPCDSSSSKAQKKDSNTMKGYAGVMSVALEIADKNPAFVDFFIVNQFMQAQETARCAALGQKISAFYTTNPQYLTDEQNIKTNALQGAGSIKAYQSLVDSGILPKGTLMKYVNMLQPLTPVEAVQKYWNACNSVLQTAIDRIKKEDLDKFVNMSIVK